MSSPTPPAYVLAAPAGESSPATWDLRVYPVGTGSKVPLAATFAVVGDGAVREGLDDAARRLGWQRGCTLASARPAPDFYAWDAWPLQPPAVPTWADAEGDAAWEPADAERAVLRVTHRRVVGSVDGVEVAVARTDLAEAGVVTLGDVRVAVTKAGVGLTPDGADELCGYVIEAARLAVRLGGDSPAASAVARAA